ncbi:MAG: hypothetical protein ACLRWQ_18745 [Flavonifractor plautii]
MQCPAPASPSEGRSSPSPGCAARLLHHGGGLALQPPLLSGRRFRHRAAPLTSSHFCSAERRYRTPGVRRPAHPTAQWTVTGQAGRHPLSRRAGPYITHVTTGQNCRQGHPGRQQYGGRHGPRRL